MKRLSLLLAAMLMTSAAYAQNHAPVVTNVTAQQRAGAKLVDITYDVADADGDTLTITVQVSSDSGRTFTITAVTLSGAAGAGIRPGTGKAIVWDAGTDYPNEYGTNFQVKVIASDGMGGGEVINDGYGDYVYVPAGEFQMGDNFNEGNAYERPVHTVYLDAYYIGKYEVTNAEYKKFIDDGGYSTKAYWMAEEYYGFFGGQPNYWSNDTISEYNVHGGGIAGNENYPVVGVSLYEAMAYCKWLSEKTGKTYRLPTEAEWEKAARGDEAKNSILGHQRRYPWGDNIDGSYANYFNSDDPNDNGLTTAGYYDGSTHGSFSTHDNSSPYGAYDMAGNVWEWCTDLYSDDYYSSSPTNNPTGPLSGTISPYIFVVRGGGFFDRNDDLRSFVRNFNNSEYRDITVNVGLRCIREK